MYVILAYIMAVTGKGGTNMSTLSKRTRFNARLTEEQKQLFEHAAALYGQSVSQFVLSHAQRAAEQAIREHEIITLSARDSRAVMESLLSPEPAGTELRRAAARYRAVMGGR